MFLLETVPLNYFLVCMASSYVNNGAKFIVTNMDHKLPLSNPDITLPDVGAMVASVKVATEKDIDYIAGKPSRMAFEAIQSSCPGKIDSESTGMFSYRYYTLRVVFTRLINLRNHKML